MKNKYNIMVPKPCHENWENMTPAEKGRFCSACSKKVVDFTKASDKEIIEHLSVEKDSCGRFLETQLNRDFSIPQQRSSYWFIATTSFLSLIGLGIQEAKAQVKNDTVQTKPTKIMIDGIIVPVYNPISVRATVEIEKNITGAVSSSTGPIFGANVIIKGTTKSTKTDLNGKFSIKVQNKDTLQITYAGFNTIEIPITDKKNYIIQMTQNEQYLQTNKKKTFFGRVFHKIGSWFN